jgi:hypothetical protein
MVDVCLLGYIQGASIAIHWSDINCQAVTLGAYISYLSLQ